MTENRIPYCDLHYAPMLPSRILPNTFCGCTKDRFCKRRYDTAVGYYAYGPGYVRHPWCPTHYSPLFVCAYDSGHAVTWKLLDVIVCVIRRRTVCPIRRTLRGRAAR